MRVGITVGTHVPAYATAMGRVLLAGLSPDELEATLGSIDPSPVGLMRSVRHSTSVQRWSGGASRAGVWPTASSRSGSDAQALPRTRSDAQLRDLTLTRTGARTGRGPWQIYVLTTSMAAA